MLVLLQVFSLLLFRCCAGSGATTEPVTCELPVPVAGYRYANAEMTGCTSSSCRQLELHGVFCAFGFVGTPTIVTKCSASNPTVTLTGCEATCLIPTQPPAGFEYNRMSFEDCTPFECDNFDLSGVECAVGYVGEPTIQSKCSLADPMVTLTGCAVECSLPAPPAGYDYVDAARIENCNSEECEDLELFGVSCAFGFVGTPTIESKCSAANPTVTLNGCDATCVIPEQPPAGFEYNRMSFEDCTPFECDNFDLSGVECAVGYVGEPTIQSKCSLSDPMVTLTGCAAECTLPSPPAGYDYVGAARIENCNSEECENFTLSGVTCSNGYTGEPSIREQCTEDFLDIELTGCEKKCVLPTFQAGYDIEASSVIGNCTPSKCIDYDLDVKCAIGYDGEPVIQSWCSNDQPEVVLAGCQLKHGCSAEAVENLDKPRNTEYLFKGYDILKGNPLHIGNDDPGFIGQIFDVSWTHGLVNSACQYQVPNGASLTNSAQSCTLSSHSSTIYGMASHTRELQGRVSFSGLEAFHSKFSGSASYQRIKSDLDTSRWVIVTAGAQCGAYTLTNTPGHIAGAEFHPSFATEVFALPLVYDEEAYSNFVSKFGTHYVKSVTLGSAYFRHNKIKKETFVSTTDTGRDFGVIARAAANLWTGRANSTHTTRLAEEFNSKVSEFYETTFAAKRLEDGKFEEWSNNDNEAPKPLDVSLMQIDDLLDAVLHLKNYQHHNPAETAENLMTKKENLKTFLSQYCGHLLKKNGVPTCDLPTRGRSPHFANLQKVNTDWTTSVTRGRPIAHTCPNYQRGNRVRYVEARQQLNFGLVDVKITCDDGNVDRFTYNNAGWLGSGFWNRQFDAGLEGFNGIQVRRELNLGVTNYRMSTDGSGYANFWSNGNTKSHTNLKGNCPDGTQVVGMEVREQSGYGLVNWRLQCYDTGVKCATEGGDCHCSVDDVTPGEIRFGANGQYTDWILTEGTVRCDSSELDPTDRIVLGDGVQGHCFCRTPPQPQIEWNNPIECATQGGECDCNGQVRYGSDTFWSAWENVQSSSSIKCTDARFGRDTAWGHRKVCQCRTMKASGRRVLSEDDPQDITPVSRILRGEGSFF